MHSLIWFWTTGIHDPVWVQAFAASALVVLTLVTLIVLSIYAWDTHTLAKTSVEQIALVKQERRIIAMRNVHAASDCVMRVQADLFAMKLSLEKNSFDNRPQPQIYPENWPEVTSGLGHRSRESLESMIALGIGLRNVDFAVREFFGSPNLIDREVRAKKVSKEVGCAIEECKRLLEERPSLRNLNFPI